MNLVVDLVIKNGEICTSRGRLRAGIAIDEEKIVAITKEVNLPDADRTIDASGKIIIPGFIDIETHIRDPGYTYKEDYTTATMAAAAGGVTLPVSQPNIRPTPDTAKRFEDHIKMAEKKAVTDFSVIANPKVIEEIPKIAKAGAPGFKFFMDLSRCDYPHPIDCFVNNDAEILEIFEAVKKTGLFVGPHPGDYDIALHFQEKCMREGLNDPISVKKYSKYRGLGTKIGVARVIQIAKFVGNRLHIWHVSQDRGTADMVRQGRAEGVNITCHANPGSLYVWKSPPAPNPAWMFRDREWEGDARALEERLKGNWGAVIDGTIDAVGTDHAPHSNPELQGRFENMWNAPSGVPRLQEYMSIFLTEVNKGTVPLEVLVRVNAENPAKILGVYPKKGAVQVGSDADLAIIDMNVKQVFTNDKVLSKCGWTNDEGREVTGVPVYTIVRGNVVFEEGEVVGKPGYGRFAGPEKGP